MILPLGQHVIYALCDPLDGMVRYVGVTKNPQYRLSEHLRCPVKEGVHKNNWIKDLQSKNLNPIFIFLDSVDQENAKKEETEWIEHFARLGVLYNHKIGRMKKITEK